MQQIKCAHCGKVIDLASEKVVSLKITLLMGIVPFESPPVRFYCNEECYTMKIMNINKNAPMLEQIDILENVRISETPIIYHIKCKQRYGFKVG